MCVCVCVYVCVCERVVSSIKSFSAKMHLLHTRKTRCHPNKSEGKKERAVVHQPEHAPLDPLETMAIYARGFAQLVLATQILFATAW